MNVQSRRFTLWVMLTILLLALLLTGAVSAQRGGRGRGDGTPIVPDGVKDAIPDAIPQVTIAAPNLDTIQATAQSLQEAVQNAANWSELLDAIPDDLPTLDELDLSQLPYELSLDDLEALLNEALQSSPEAYAALGGFASQNLGIGIAPLYAGDVTTTVQTTTGQASQISNEALDAIMQQVLAEFPTEVQAILAQAATISGQAYWGILPNGAAVLYADACQGSTNCVIDLDTLQVQIANSSLGVYGLYVMGTAPGSANEALALIQTTYPALTGLQFVPVSDTYTFMAESYSSSVGKLVYAGVTSYAGQSLVYAGVITGEAYIGSLPINIPQF